jgi:MFS family permease
MFIGFSFHSGATEAFAYDSLKDVGQEGRYPEVIGKSSSIVIAGTLISTFVGGYLYGLAPQAPFYAWIVFLLLSVILLLFTNEPRVDTVKFNVKNYLVHLKEGTLTLFNHKLHNYLVPLFTFAIMIKLCQGIVRQSAAAYFSFTGETFGYVFAAISIPAIYLSFKFGQIRMRFSDRSLILFNLIFFLFAFILVVFTQNMVLGVAYYLIVNAAENLAKPLSSSIINERIDSKHRATVLSTLALFSQIPYIILVLFFSRMTEATNLPYLFGGYAIVVLLVTIYSYLFVKPQ